MAATSTPTHPSRRPLSSIQLLDDDSDDDVGAARPHRVPTPPAAVGGFSNAAFDLSSPTTSTPAPRRCRPTSQLDEIVEEEATACGGRDDYVWRRRRKTDPEGNYSYHQDYQEALSSLLWEPYECRQPSTSVNMDDDADVSLWLYPPHNTNNNFPYGLDCMSTSSSTSSISSACDKVGTTDAEVRDLGSRGTVPRGALVSRNLNTTFAPQHCQSEFDLAPRRMLVQVDTGGGVDESCYRAVPVVVATLPTISCVNTITTSQDNVSNVAVVQDESAVQCSARTFTSTEAQTDEVAVAGVEATSVPPSVNNREQRRRERRERRHQRRVNTSHNHMNHEATWTTQLVEPLNVVVERLPDILNSHLPPPYSTLPLGGGVPPPPLPHPMPPPPPPGMPVPIPVQVQTVIPGSPPPPGIRFPFQIAPNTRRRSRRAPRGPHYSPEDEPKSCCGVIVTQTVSIRWFIVMIAFVGICCAVVGTVLGAMKASGREHLTVSLLMIGVGIVLITVSGVAWRLTAHDAPSCRVMLGLGRGEEGVAEPNRRFVPRLPPSYGRPHHPYAAMMYPEFQYRPPPPSYQASMQEYRLRLLLLDRHHAAPNTNPASGGNALSPPPTYRSHPGTLRGAPHQDFSRPPSYRSRTSSTRPALDPNGNTPVHSRDPSLNLSEPCGGSTVNVISVHGGSDMNEPEVLDSIKMVPDQDLPLRMMIDKGSRSGSTVDLGKDGNLVTIVSTGSDSSPVIVTVSGSTTTTCGSTSQGIEAEMEILAHL